MAQAPAGGGAPAAARAAAPAEDSAFSDQILDWMKQGDRLAEARPPEAVDLSDLVPTRPTPLAVPIRRSQIRKQRLRRWLTVGMAAAAVAGVLWTMRQSETIVDRPAFAESAAAVRVERAPTPGSAQPAGVTAAAPAALVAKPSAPMAAAPAAPAPSRNRNVAARHRRRARR